MFKILLGGAVLALLAVQPALSDTLSKPTGAVILEVSGKIANTNDGATADFDMAMLSELEGGTTATSSPWYDGVKTFSGPLGKALLKAVGATGTTLRVTALNDYVTEIPVSDFNDFAVVLATEIDGKPMSVRDKGPIFIVYPYDSDQKLQHDIYYTRSVWQLERLILK